MASAGKPALIVVDLQNDFCPPDGSLAVEGGRDIAPTINKLLELPFALKIATRDFHPQDHVSFASNHAGKKPFTDSHTFVNPENPEEKESTLLWPDHCVQGTNGCELISELDQSKIDFIQDKGQDKRVESYSAFGPPFRRPKVAMSGLDTKLRDAGITRVFCCGLAFDYCVKWTAIDAAKEGFETYVIEDATKGIDRTSKGHADTLQMYKDHGVKVISSTSPELQRLAVV